MSRIAAPYGSWPGLLDASQVAAAARRLALPRWHPRGACFVEGRPDRGGRQSVVWVGDDGARRSLTPDAHDVRSRVHEYGGGEYALAGERLYWVADGRPGIQRAEGAALGAAQAEARYADPVVAPDGRFLVAVEEDHAGPGEPRNRLVAFDLRDPRGAARRVLVEDHDFVASPAFSPRGDRLCCVAWDHPDMPWDGSVLLELAVAADGPRPGARRVAGGRGESIFQPGYSPAGALTWVSDASGWWNLWQRRGESLVPLCPRAAEFGRPQWGFGMRSWGFLSESRLLCCYREAGASHLGELDAASGALRDIPLAWQEIDAIDVAGGRALLLAGSASEAPCVVALEPAGGGQRVLARSHEGELDDAGISPAEPIELASAGGRRCHAFLYRPRHPRREGPPGARPPLLVKSHGGPTAAASRALQTGIQYWTQRGFAVVDVDYAGSTGYGRAYRALLDGCWGIADVEDCAHAARQLAAQGEVDGQRLAIRGASAGGYTTLCALTFQRVFHAGASHYGIGDLEALARDTHKFESRYLERLVGPYPARRDLYRARSPIHHVEQLSCPVIFFQGGQDRVVPPAQAEAMVAALAARGIAHAYLLFPEERHGFRDARNVSRALEAELSFYGQVFGFETDARERVALRAAGAAS